MNRSDCHDCHFAVSHKLTADHAVLSLSTLNMIFSGRQRSQFSFRAISAAVLGAWMVTLACCWVHCAFGNCDLPGASGAASQASCHGGVETPSCHSAGTSESSSAGQPSGLGCLAQLDFAFLGDGISLPKAALHAMVEAAWIGRSLLSEALLDSSLEIRPQESPDRVLTPLVYLGPAHRSHAPPPLG